MTPVATTAEHLARALSRLREGTEILRTGGGGTTLTSAECNALLEERERLLAGRRAMETAAAIAFPEIGAGIRRAIDAYDAASSPEET